MKKIDFFSSCLFLYYCMRSHPSPRHYKIEELLIYIYTIDVAINEIRKLRSALKQLHCNNDFYDDAYTTVLKKRKE